MSTPSEPDDSTLDGGCPVCAHGTNLLTHIDTPVFIVSPEGRFQFVNDACLRLIGSPSLEQSLKFNAFKLPAMQAVGLDVLLHRCLAGEHIEQEVDYISMWGKPARVRLEAVPLKSPNGEVLAAACVLEEHQRVQEQEGRINRLTAELKSVREDLRELDQLRNRIIAKVSHELRTPLLPLHGYLRLLEDRSLGPLNEKQAKAIRVARRNASRLIDLVEQTLLVTHESELTHPVKLQTIEPAVLLRDAVDALQPILTSRAIEVEVDSAPDMPRLRGDRSKLTRVLMTLLDNAQKYAGDGGRIRIAACAQGEQVELEVSNSGVGIPADQRERVFEAFYQVDEDEAVASGGVGLGLAIARDAVEAHGGQIRVDEPDGYATTIRVMLPVGGAAPNHVHASPLAPLRVLLLGAEPDRLDGLQPPLENAGFDVRAAPVDATLQQRLTDWPPDAVILGVTTDADLRTLPRLHAAIRPHHLPVLVVLLGNTAELADRAVDIGATAVVSAADAASQLPRLLESVDRP